MLRLDRLGFIYKNKHLFWFKNQKSQNRRFSSNPVCSMKNYTNTQYYRIVCKYTIILIFIYIYIYYSFIILFSPVLGGGLEENLRFCDSWKNNDFCHSD